MPKPTFPAAGEAVSANINRRTAILAGFAATTASLVPIASNAAVAAPEAIGGPDPLVAAIAAFRAGMANYNANAPQDDDGGDAYAAISWMPPMEVLEDWDTPATSMEGVIEAVRLALDECTDFESSPIVRPVLHAALAYLEAMEAGHAS